MRYNIIIVRFSEIWVKSLRVRKKLVKILRENIKLALTKNKIKAKVYTSWDRIFVETNKIKKSINILRHVFGIVSASPAIKMNLSELENNIKKYSYLAKNKKFAVRVNRVGKHNFTSKQVEEKLGELILKSVNSKVKLKNPDITFFVEIRNDIAYLYFDVVKCVGGLPLGCEDEVLCVIKNKKDLIACWLMMKRGCSVKIKSSISIKPLKKWMYSKKVEIIRNDKSFSNLPLVSGNTMEDGLINSEKIIFYPIFCLSEEEIEEIYRKINS
ncbi:MAG: THUMP domain-containing protein [Candidatus Aenigmarchaeota archaeon]|nr:THUMP domain-containing protein [Candidatus Aenigmarchaeota archaeon]MDW8149668.1 THUMP domain-containing protein [Candidatus Aenigmarchaeota archaeon]